MSAGGLRALARTGPEQTLLARFEYTGVQRQARTLRWQSVDDGLIVWFENELWGVGTGLQEGRILGRESDAVLDWVPEVIGSSGARVCKLTRVASQPEVAASNQMVRTQHDGSWRVVNAPKKTREVLPLAPTFAETLARLGRHTRRNIRSALKFAASKQLGFELLTEGRLPEAQRSALAERTDRYQLDPQLMARLENYADSTNRPFRSVARNAEGRVVSYGCGYLGGSAAAFLLYQLNDPEWNPVSPSLLHRGLLMEQLIAAGCRELVFVHGCSGVLWHGCERQLLEEFMFTRRSATGYAMAGLICALKPETSIGRLARLTLSRKPPRAGEKPQSTPPDPTWDTGMTRSSE